MLLYRSNRTYYIQSIKYHVPCQAHLCIIAAVKPAIFLDRDGVLIENIPTYVRSWADVHIYPQALEALKQAAASPYLIVLVTNQSGIGRGLIALETVQEINRQLVKEIDAAGGRVDGVFLCPHAPEENCLCRKPQPGLLLEAAKTLQIDLDRSIMIGDAASDVQAGYAAGVGKLVLVRTGRGAEQLRTNNLNVPKAVLLFENLAEALATLV